MSCGEGQLYTYSSVTGTYYCENHAELCSTYYGPGVFNVSSKGMCIRLVASPTTIVCPQNFSPVCGITCICVSTLSEGGGGTSLPGANSTSLSTNSILSQQANPVRCNGTIECWFINSLPYAILSLSLTSIALLFLLYIFRRCCCPNLTIFPFCLCIWLHRARRNCEKKNPNVRQKKKRRGGSKKSKKATQESPDNIPDASIVLRV